MLAGERNPAGTGTKPKNKSTPMKIPKLPNGTRAQGFTLIELLVVISIIAILAGLGLKAFPAAIKKARITESLSNCKQITTTLFNFGSDNDGQYPSNAPSTDGGKTPGAPLAAGDFSNKAFDNLISRYQTGKGLFINKNSKYCKGAKIDTSLEDSKTLGKGQNDWLYVVGMSTSTNGNWPLIATAPKSASEHTYTSDKNALGGVWEGTDVIVGFCDGSAKPAGEKEMNRTAPTATFVKSPIDGANIFTGTDDWLGKTVIILAPEPGGT